MHGIDLAQQADFDLGALRVRPARCEVELNGISRTLQRRVMQVLVVLAQARCGVVSQNDLVARCWRGLSVSDDAIYRCISKLRKLAADYPEAPYAIEAIPGVGYRLTSSSVGDDNSEVESRARHDRGFRLRAFGAAAAIAVLVLTAATFWIVRGRAADEHRLVRVAVQPFETLTSSDDARALARRVPNEIVNEFGDTQIATVLAAEQTDKETPSPGLIVTGVVRNEGPNVGVDVRVEDGTSHAALWSMEFKRDRREASDLPMEVAARVADVINMAIFARSADPPLNDDYALSSLLQANEMIRGSQEGDWAQMIDRAKAVVARHPEFAFGHDVLSVAYAAAADDIDIPDRARAMRAAAWQEANLTLKLDPQDAGAYVVLSGLESERRPYNYQPAEAILLRGIKFAKHPKQPLAALYSYEGLLLGNVGRLREALSFQMVAHASDEWGPPRTAKLAFSYANMGNLTAARAYLQKATQLWPNHPGVWRLQQYIAGFFEQPSDALDAFRLLDARSSLHDSNVIWRDFVQAKAAHSQQMTGAASLKIRMAGDQGTIDREHEIMMLSGLGQTKQAFEVANSLIDHRDLEPWFLFTPVTRTLRQDPSFIPLAARLGLIRYWRETGKWPDFCTDAAKGSECSPQLLALIKSR
ncbi:MAG TPA: winged helix-turn-helix domain-containing protein [Sphingomicrobium sp.]|nr:winged helix-turn-helix domain-containing protein [Sphingomicrobium sp.]